MSVPCPKCKEQIIIIRSPLQHCANCHTNFWNSELNIEVDFPRGDSLNNPKSRKWPDWIEQEEQLDMQDNVVRSEI